jgi:antitoxin VapB
LNNGRKRTICSTMNKHEKVDKSKQLNLKGEEAYELAAKLAKLHGDTLTGAVISALREKLARDTLTSSQQERFDRITALAREYRSLVGTPTMTAEEAIGYDESGLPT